MKYRKLGNTDLDVSLIALGTMTWGEQNSEAEAHAQLDYAVAHGVNLIDTAGPASCLCNARWRPGFRGGAAPGTSRRCRSG